MTDKNTDISYDDAILVVGDNINAALIKSPPVIRKYTAHLSHSSGKLIRARALLTCALGDGNRVGGDAALLASAVEVLHLATLVHDDVIDDAATRRGRASLQKRFGKRSAVICGDYLFCAALSLAHSAAQGNRDLPAGLIDYMSRVCGGELSQHENNGNIDLSPLKYLKIIAGKTAALFEASFHGGAVLSGVDKSEINKYSRLGRYIGMIFQLTDDCMNYLGADDKKPVNSDYEQGVITLPLIYTFEKQPVLKEKARQNKVLAKQICDAVTKSGGIAYANGISKRYYKKAQDIISSLNVAGQKKEKLICILNAAARK